MNLIEILVTVLAFIGLLNAAAFMYWMHVDSKLTARDHAMNARLDATWKELMDLRKDVK